MFEPSCGQDNTIRHFWGAHQAFFKQLLNSLKAKFAIAEAQEAIDRGECVVIGLLSTGEAKANARFDRANANENGVVEEEVRTTPSSSPFPHPNHHHHPVLPTTLSLTPLHPSLHDRLLTGIHPSRDREGDAREASMHRTPRRERPGDRA